jgi:hypothetical protein
MTKTRWLLIGFLGVLAAVRVALPEIVKWRANKLLRELEDYKGHINGVHLALWRGTAVLQDVEFEHKEGDFTLTLPKTAMSISWPQLFRGRVVGDLLIDSPRARVLVKKPAKAPGEITEKTQDAKAAIEKKTGKSLPDLLASLVPFRVREFEIKEGSFRIQEIRQDVDALQEKDKDLPPGAPEAQQKEKALEARLTHVHLIVRNLTNAAQLTGTSYASGSASAQVMDQGRISLELQLNPVAKTPAFSLGFTATEINLAELNPLFRWQWGVDVTQGTFAMFMEAEAAGGGFKGYLKPFIQDLQMHDETQDPDKKLGARIKEAIVSIAAGILKNKESKNVASRIPFEGRFDDPEVGMWEAVVNVLRHAFIKALSPGLDRKK